MPENTHYDDGRPHEVYDDFSRIYTRYSQEGEILEQRPYTAEESVVLDKAAANRQTLNDQLEADLAVLLSSIETLKAIYSKTNAEIGPKDTKDVARETRRVARSLVRVVRLLTGLVGSIDSGTE